MWKAEWEIFESHTKGRESWGKEVERPKDPMHLSYLGSEAGQGGWV
jgi:hypothetical protein